MEQPLLPAARESSHLALPPRAQPLPWVLLQGTNLVPPGIRHLGLHPHGVQRLELHPHGVQRRLHDSASAATDHEHPLAIVRARVAHLDQDTMDLPVSMDPASLLAARCCSSPFRCQ